MVCKNILKFHFIAFAKKAICRIQTLLQSPYTLVFIFEPFFWLAGLRQFNLSGEKKPLLESKKILIVFFGEIGDSMLLTPFLRELKKNFTQANITLAVRPKTADLIRHCPHVNSIVPIKLQNNRIPSKNYRWDFNHVNLCRNFFWAEKFDLAILPRWDVDYYQASFFVYLSGAKRRVGYSANVKALKKRLNPGHDLLFTDVIKDSDTTHEIVHTLKIIEFLGGHINDASLEAWWGENDEAYVGQFLDQNKHRLRRPVICLGISSLRLTKRWPIDRYILLIEWLMEKYHATILLLGDSHDKQLGDKVNGRIKNPYMLNYIGQPNIRETLCLLRNCDLYIGNDTGLKHLASYWQIPIIEISSWPKDGFLASDNSAVRFKPWKSEYLLIQPDHALTPCKGECTSEEAHCIMQISVEQVKEALTKFLEMSNRFHYVNT